MNLNIYLKFFLFSVKFVDKKSSLENQRGFLKKGGDILSHWLAVPSALAGLTSLFEMDRGEPRCNNHLKSVVTRLSVTNIFNYIDILNLTIL